MIWISAAKPGRSSENTTARRNEIISRERATNESGFANLTSWRTTLLRALLVLVGTEVQR